MIKNEELERMTKEELEFELIEQRSRFKKLNNAFDKLSFKYMQIKEELELLKQTPSKPVYVGVKLLREDEDLNG